MSSKRTARSSIDVDIADIVLEELEKETIFEVKKKKDERRKKIK